MSRDSEAQTLIHKKINELAETFVETFPEKSVSEFVFTIIYCVTNKFYQFCDEPSAAETIFNYSIALAKSTYLERRESKDETR